VSAVYYLMGERFSEDPFVLFQLRGRTRAQLLSDLAVKRRALLAKKAKEAKEAAPADAPPQPAAAGSLNPAPAAIRDPNRWWNYGAALDPGLVVITPAMEGDTGMDEAGPLPLAEDGRFPEAGKLFVEQLKAHGAACGAQAMATAMAAGTKSGEAEPAAQSSS
jgi:uncharacterized Zn finger protein